MAGGRRKLEAQMTQLTVSDPTAALEAASGSSSKKRSLSPSPPPTQPSTQPASEDSGSPEGSLSTDETQGSSKPKRQKTVTSKEKKEDKEKAQPKRTSKRALTKANSKASMVKAGVIPSASSKRKLEPKEPREPKVQAPPLNPLQGIPEHTYPAKQLFVFGTGDMGQFGLGTDMLGEIKRPRLHAWFEEQVVAGTLGEQPGAGLEAVAVGGMHNLVVDELGRVWSWGINDGAALGRQTADVTDPETNTVIDSEVLETKPTIIQKLVDEKFRTVFVAAGDSVSIALSDAGELRAWGSFRSSEGILGFDGKPNSPKLQYNPISLAVLKKERFVQAACGGDHVIALTTTGHVFAWGDARQGALGRKVLERHIKDGLDPDRLALRNIVHVASGMWHSFAIDKDGVVYAWGLNSQGQLGLGDESYFDPEIEEKDRELPPHIASPQPVMALHPVTLGAGRRCVQISGGEHHTIFLISDGSVYACGRHDSSQLGLAEDHPTTQLMKILKEQHPSTMACVPYPVQVFFPPSPTDDNTDPPLGSYAESLARAPQRPIKNISAGTRHNLAVSQDGIVYGWGYGSQYQLGMGEVDEKDVPGRVKSAAMPPFDVDSVYSGGQHCLLMVRRKVATPAP